jgi:hypothetical protein
MKIQPEEIELRGIVGFLLRHRVRRFNPESALVE